MKQIFAFLLLAGLTCPVSAQLTINVTAVPASTPQSDNIHIAGSFNGWDPTDVSNILSEDTEGVYSVTLDIPAGEIQFKFTRGSWATVEGNENGGFLPDRTYDYQGGQVTIDLTILSWEDLDSGGGAESTAADNVYILDDDFYIPQLDRTRRIWIYLPPDYEESDKDYPVLYMHDGQNLFDAATSFAGEWEVDETLNELHEQGDYGCIVIGIENGGAERLNEYSPWLNAQYNAGGQGDEYVDFIVDDLKPYVDANYRTLSGQQFTGIAGSSMGGLISHYAGIAHQDVFGKVGAFSSSFWFSDESYFQVGDTGDQGDMKFYYIVGQGEGQQMVDDTEGMFGLMSANGFGTEELYKEVHADGQHSEWYWRREFGDAYQWLFSNVSTSSQTEETNPKLRLYPNPVNGRIFIENYASIENGNVSVYNLKGELVHREALSSSVNLGNLSAGVYIIKINSESKVVFADRVVVD